ncbi:Protein GrpE [Syntrophobacter sp. SbD1]|nr:Protein GrpE [Syntrophobacter sp. SbD1]
MTPVKKRHASEHTDHENQAETTIEASQNTENDCRQLLSKREEELKEAQDRVLRLVAELDNTRKRLEREKSEGISYANESIMRQLIEVIDNLERAVEHGEKDESCEGLLDGVRMTLKSFADVFARFGATPFESVGSIFDPNRHEAVFQEQNPDYPDMTVTRELQKGYTLRDRLLRPARVGVARNAKEDNC